MHLPIRLLMNKNHLLKNYIKGNFLFFVKRSLFQKYIKYYILTKLCLFTNCEENYVILNKNKLQKIEIKLFIIIKRLKKIRCCKHFENPHAALCLLAVPLWRPAPVPARRAFYYTSKDGGFHKKYSLGVELTSCILIVFFVMLYLLLKVNFNYIIFTTMK